MWPTDGPFVFDICTMWDIYRTQLPLITALYPARAVELANALLSICEEEGNFPIGYRMAKGADRFTRQASALVHTFLADLCQLGVPGIDWDWALCHMDTDLRRSYGEDYLLRGLAEPDFPHSRLGLRIPMHGEGGLLRRRQPTGRAVRTPFRPVGQCLRARRPAAGFHLLRGRPWNYSFRLLHDMRTRIGLAGGEGAFIELLDQFFGYHADPVKQLGERPTVADQAAGYALNRFEGLNNEPDMEAPWAYHYAGRPDRTAEVVHAGINNMFGSGTRRAARQ